ncbi:MAG: hypothetical protein GY787_06480 [Alteromonadales bacterium]|nr:hypothetical protein [Alteromonadales bacterium]
MSDRQYTGNHPRWGMIRERELIHDAKRKLHEMDKSLKSWDDSAARQEGDVVDTPDVDQVKGAKAKREIGQMRDGGPVGERATTKG